MVRRNINRVFLSISLIIAVSLIGVQSKGRDGEHNRQSFTPAILLHLTLNWRSAFPKVIMPHNVLVFWERTRVGNA